MNNLIKSNAQQICRWHAFANTAELEQVAVTQILRSAQDAIKKRNAFHIVLAGGTTPRRIYQALKSANTDWNTWHVYFGDERCLATNHTDRNSLMASQVWLDHVSIPIAQIYPIPAEDGALVASEKYAALLNKVGTFDLVLLGLGEDGHTASLFPQHDVGDRPNAAATLAIFNAPKPPPQRVSLSARRLSDAEQVMFLVTGMGKKTAVSNWRAGSRIPATTITPNYGVDIYIERQLLSE